MERESLVFRTWRGWVVAPSADWVLPSQTASSTSGIGDSRGRRRTPKPSIPVRLDPVSGLMAFADPHYFAFAMYLSLTNGDEPPPPHTSILVVGEDWTGRGIPGPERRNWVRVMEDSVVDHIALDHIARMGGS